MGILDRAKAAVGGDELQSAFTEQERLRKAIAELGERRTQLERELREASAPLGELSLDESATGRKEYDKALAKVEALERDIRRNGDAQEASRAKLQTVNERIGVLTHADRLKTLTRIAKERAVATEALQDALNVYGQTYQRFVEKTEKLFYAFPAECDAVGIDVRRLADAVGVELFRTFPVSPIDRNAASRVPGANLGIHLDAPDKIPALADAVREQHDAALANFKASITPVEAGPQPARPTAADDPDTEILSEPAVPSVTIDARAMPIRKVMLSVDGRTK